MLFVSMRVEPFARAASFDDQLAHVRNVENADIVSHGLMLLDDARVLHRHEPSARTAQFSRRAARVRRKVESVFVRLRSRGQARRLDLRAISCDLLELQRLLYLQLQ